jgi:low temperature requirement protein LtrA
MEADHKAKADADAAARRATDAQVLEDAERPNAARNERQAKRMPMLFSLTIGAAIAAMALLVQFSKRILACILAFAAGALISALAIELGYKGTQALLRSGFTSLAAWGFVSAGFAVGAMIYYGISRHRHCSGGQSESA